MSCLQDIGQDTWNLKFFKLNRLQHRVIMHFVRDELGVAKHVFACRNSCVLACASGEGLVTAEGTTKVKLHKSSSMVRSLLFPASLCSLDPVRLFAATFEIAIVNSNETPCIHRTFGNCSISTTYHLVTRPQRLRPDHCFDDSLDARLHRVKQ